VVGWAGDRKGRKGDNVGSGHPWHSNQLLLQSGVYPPPQPPALDVPKPAPFALNAYEWATLLSSGSERKAFNWLDVDYR
jgi:hypothetical protein